jgi:hypothetical protein
VINNNCAFIIVVDRSIENLVNWVINKDETVTDISTGLMWQRESEAEFMFWQNSIEYSENLVLSNYNDWCLPTIKELHSIVDYTKIFPNINKLFFWGNHSERYWSSTSNVNSDHYAWRVIFYTGSNCTSWKSKTIAPARTVRGGQHQSLNNLYIRIPGQASKWQPGN